MVTEEYFPEERRDQFIYRGKKVSLFPTYFSLVSHAAWQVIVECQKHDDYQQAIRWLLGFIEDYAGHGKHVASKGTESHQALMEDPALNNALSELRTLLERFANGESLQVVFDAANDLYRDAQEDAELRDWFRSVDAYIRKVSALHQALIASPDMLHRHSSNQVPHP